MLIREETFISCSIDLLSLIVSVIGAYFVVLELQGSKGFEEAEFIVNLNQAFISNEHYAETYSKLENITKENVEFTAIEISNYLTFFETTYLLLKKEVISIDYVNSEYTIV